MGHALIDRWMAWSCTDFDRYEERMPQKIETSDPRKIYVTLYACCRK